MKLSFDQKGRKYAFSEWLKSFIFTSDKMKII